MNQIKKGLIFLLLGKKAQSNKTTKKFLFGLFYKMQINTFSGWIRSTRNLLLERDYHGSHICN